MWLFTKFGFFSIVRDKDAGTHAPAHHPVMIRARVRGDLVKLCELHPLRGARVPIVELEKRDYPYRIHVSELELAELMHQFAATVDYTNFKDMIHAQPKDGDARSALYMEVWSAMNGAERKMREYAERAKTWAKRFRTGKRLSSLPGQRDFGDFGGFAELSDRGHLFPDPQEGPQRPSTPRGTFGPGPKRGGPGPVLSVPGKGGKGKA